MRKHVHSDNTIFVERREETDAITNLSARNAILARAINRARQQLARGHVENAKKTLDDAMKADRRMGNA